MSQSSLKSISGITSITTPAGVESQLTVHTNDTTEKLKVTQSGIDVTGVVTATSADINGDLDVDGHTNLDNVSIAGVVTATSFVGDGSGLTGAGPTLTNGADNRVITASSASAIQGEANMTFDGSTLTLTPGSSAGDVTSLVLGRTSSAPAAQTTAVVTGGIPVSGVPGIFFGSTNTNLPAIGFQTPNSSNGHIVFNPKGSEKVRIDSSGRLLLGTTTEGESTADNLTIADSGSCGITIRSGTSAEGNIFFSDGTSGADEYRGIIRFEHNTNEMVIKTIGTDRLRFKSDGNIVHSSTTAFQIAKGTTAERPGSPVDGMIRFNSTLSQTEEYRDSGWFGLSNKSTVSGGTVTTSGSYTIHTFTSSGTFTVSGQAKTGVDYLLVAGGAGGGSTRAGAGGAGGMTETTGASIPIGTYTITVGAGGAGAVTNGNGNADGAAGSTTSFGSLSSVVGGGYGGGQGRVGGAGGSGGGGSDGQNGGAGTSGQGNAGGNSISDRGGGGGGGKGGPGNVGASSLVGGAGGAAGASNYSGSTVNYAGGGGGGSRDNGAGGNGGGGGAGVGGQTSSSLAGNATANQGSGGGGGARHHGASGASYNGGNGGSGIVIIRYLT